MIYYDYDNLHLYKHIYNLLAYTNSAFPSLGNIFIYLIYCCYHFTCEGNESPWPT